MNPNPTHHARPTTASRFACGLAALAILGVAVSLAATPASALFIVGCTPRIGSEVGARCGAGATNIGQYKGPFVGGGISCGPRGGPDQYEVGCDEWGY